MPDSLRYRPREFALADLEGLSRRALDRHLLLYQRHVDAVNELLEAMVAPSPRSHGSEGSRFAFEYNGMVLHELYFESLTGALGAVPPSSGEFHAAAHRCFGGIEAWKASLRRLVHAHGEGWAVCLRERAGRRLFNCWVESNSTGLPVGADPVLVIDLWEHAWLEDYGPDQREHYVDAVLTQMDWGVIERRCTGDSPLFPPPLPRVPSD